jgi:CRP/FNR family transcriptional regulator, cyclic AMP receptor protein
MSARDVPRSAGAPPFTPGQLELLSTAGRSLTWHTGEVLLRQGTPAALLIVIREGLVKVTADSPNGYTSVLAVRGAGELLGELSCVDGGPCSATAVAYSDGEGVAISARRFVQILEQHGQLALAVLRTVTERLRHADRMRAEHGAYGAELRVARVLLELAERHGVPVGGHPGGLDVLISQQDLAGAAGTSLPSVVRTLRTLRAEGLISAARGRVTVLDSRGLASWEGT